MLKGLKSAVAIACLSLGLAGAANAAAPDLSGFDARAADGWAQKLVLCDTIAFLRSQPDLNADLIFVRRDDSRRFDMLLPPDFVGGGQWYKDGYQHLYLRLRHDKKISSGELTAAQNTLGRQLVHAYRVSNGRLDQHFLDSQDRYCRAMARENGQIIS